MAEVMLDYFIKKVHKWSKWRSWLAKPQVVISVPSGITSVERRAVRNSAERVGARSPFLIEEPIAAALTAAGVKVFHRSPKKNEPRGYYCAIGACSDCFMIVNGQPNVRTCVTSVKEGMTVETQIGKAGWKGLR